EKFKRWNRAALPILPETWKYTASEGKKKQLDILRSLLTRADVTTVVNACDAGREGELIFRLVYDYCKCRKPVQRLWVSSLEDSALRDGFAHLRPGSEYDDLCRAALCRSQADFLVGINATRLFSCLYGSTLTVGRVQSPTLAMLVERETAIAAFTSEPFYTPEIDFRQRDAAPIFRAAGTRELSFAAAEAIRAAADGRTAVVLSVEKAQKTAAPPKLYDLTALQRDANRLLDYTAQQTLDYAQSLYEKKLITYPRTDSRYITEDMRDTVTALLGETDFVPNIDALVGAVSDHHAILPTKASQAAVLDTLPSGERGLLNLIAARLRCAAAPAHVYESVTVALDCGGSIFTAKGKTVIATGWKTQPDADGEATLPELSKGHTFDSVTASVREGFTTPSKHFTEDTLLHEMERLGLGTPATRAAVIEKIIKGGYVTRQKKQLVPTEKGSNLIAILPDEMKSPLLTAEWEQKLKLVERGELDGAEFTDGIAALVKGLVAAHSAPLSEFASLLAPPPKGETVGKCLRCGANVTETPKGFFCSNRACKFALWRDSRFWTAKGKILDKKTAAALLCDERVSFSDLKSERTGKTYAATVVLEDADGKVNFKLEFDNNGRKAA
ncbi:MAG: DNA topoisomerase III, partial [Oscillospiraceae bacterium]|nr:DNA topoisomerase III [Oscillospiraceae bacterium]